MALPRRTQLATCMHTALWFALIAVFLGVSAPGIFRAAFNSPIHVATSEYYSSDTMLGEDGGSKRIVALFESTPSSRSVIIFVNHQDQRSEFLGMLVAYLAWPHPVQILDATKFSWATESALAELRSAAAVALCGIKPQSPWPISEKIGDTIQFLPVQTFARR